MMTEIRKEFKCIGEADLVIIGGSCTGVFAALRAAKLGIKVILIEQQAYLGGTATNAFVNQWHNIYDIDYDKQIIGGLTTEVLEKLRHKKQLKYFEKQRNMFHFSSESLKEILDDAVVTEKNIKTFLCTQYCFAVTHEKTIESIVVNTVEGIFVVKGKCFMDASGNGVLCRDVGIMQYTYDNPLPPTPTAYVYLPVKNMNISLKKHIEEMIIKYGDDYGIGDDWGFYMDVPNLDDVFVFAESHIYDKDLFKADNYTAANFKGRKQLYNLMRLLKEKSDQIQSSANIIAGFNLLGMRDTVHYETEYKMSESDVLSGKKFSDAVANGTFPVDIHHFDKPGVTVKNLDGTQAFITRGKTITSRWLESGDYAKFWQVPYRALINKSFPNLILAGRMLNAEHPAFSALRVMVTLNQLGEAAGTATKLALENKNNYLTIDTDSLRNLLSKQGCIML